MAPMASKVALKQTEYVSLMKSLETLSWPPRDMEETHQNTERIARTVRKAQVAGVMGGRFYLPIAPAYRTLPTAAASIGHKIDRVGII